MTFSFHIPARDIGPCLSCGQQTDGYYNVQCSTHINGICGGSLVRSSAVPEPLHVGNADGMACQLC